MYLPFTRLRALAFVTLTTYALHLLTGLFDCLWERYLIPLFDCFRKCGLIVCGSNTGKVIALRPWVVALSSTCR